MFLNCASWCYSAFIFITQLHMAFLHIKQNDQKIFYKKVFIKNFDILLHFLEYRLRSQNTSFTMCLSWVIIVLLIYLLVFLYIKQTVLHKIFCKKTPIEALDISLGLWKKCSWNQFVMIVISSRVFWFSYFVRFFSYKGKCSV